MKSFMLFARIWKSAFIMFVSLTYAGIGYAQVTASHDVRMRIIGSSRLAVQPSASKVENVGSSTMNSIDMELRFTSLKGMEQKRMIVSVSGPSGVSLGLKESGTGNLQNRWSGIGQDSVSYDMTNTMSSASKGMAGNAASSLSFTVSDDDAKNRSPGSSDSIVVIYTVI